MCAPTLCFGTPYLCICQPVQDFLNDYLQKNVNEIRKTKKVLVMPDDAPPDSSLAAPWIIKNFHGFLELTQFALPGIVRNISIE